ncbi:MAG: PAS domain S-box protein [Candidatus Brocadiales bacterium]|nr:PAS domain S-box protein [Candidatus Brocadiales bacterium]
MENLQKYRNHNSDDNVNSFNQDIKVLVENIVDVDSTDDVLNIVVDAIESNISGIIITDRKGIIKYVNTSFLRMFEFIDKIEVLGHNVANFFASKEIKKFSDIHSIIDAVDGETEEFLALHKDGTKFFIEVSSSCIRNHKGLVVGMMASFINITKRKAIDEEREKLIVKLQSANKKIKKLQGLIPICAWCKNIRDDKGYWYRVEEYIHKHTKADFTHGVCPECNSKYLVESDEENGG